MRVQLNDWYFFHLEKISFCIVKWEPEADGEVESVTVTLKIIEQCQKGHWSTASVSFPTYITHTQLLTIICTQFINILIFIIIIQGFHLSGIITTKSSSSSQQSGYTDAEKRYNVSITFDRY